MSLLSTACKAIEKFGEEMTATLQRREALHRVITAAAHDSEKRDLITTLLGYMADASESDWDALSRLVPSPETHSWFENATKNVLGVAALPEAEFRTELRALTLADPYYSLNESITALRIRLNAEREARIAGYRARRRR